MMIITVRGSKSGKKYRVPVSFVVDGDRLLVLSLKKRTWWRNLRGGQSVSLRYRGQVKNANADVIEADDDVAQALSRYLEPRPDYAKYFGIRLDNDGKAILADVAQAAKARVIVSVQRPTRT